MEKDFPQSSKIRVLSDGWVAGVEPHEAEVDIFVQEALSTTEHSGIALLLTKVQRINSALLKSSAQRLLNPRSKEVEFLKSSWQDLMRFQILDKLARWDLVRSDTYKVELLARELRTMFLWPSTSPWCTYGMIFGLSCASCPFFLLADPPLKVTLFTKRRLCWVPNGFWSPLMRALSLFAGTPSAQTLATPTETLQQTLGLYTKVKLPVKLAALGMKKGG